MSTLRILNDQDTLVGIGLNGLAGVLPWEYSDSNVPWAYTSESQFTADWPANVEIVDIQTTSSDFFTNLQNTVNAAGRRVVVRLGIGTYHLNQFRPIGGGSVNYSFGFWFPNLQGLLGRGADKTFIQMDANSMTQAQLDGMKVMTEGSNGDPLQQGFARIDGNKTSPVCVAGITFQAEDQQLLTEVSTLPASAVFVPTPAPHTGLLLITFDTEFTTYLSYCRFLAAGRGINSQPPFECANIHTGKGHHNWHHLEVDGRRAASVDPARPRRCGVFLINAEYDHKITDSWMHHSAISRYAANDQNSTRTGSYTVERCKIEQITNTRNTDPALNNGNSLGGFTNASPFGWESIGGTITVRNTIIVQDNPNPTSGTGQIPMPFQLTHVQGSVAEKTTGQFYGYDNVYRWTPFPWLDGFAGFRIGATTSWITRGIENTCHIIDNGVDKIPFVVPNNVAWPPSAAYLAANGVAKTTHFLVRA